MKHTPGPWTVEIGYDGTTIESPIQTIATNVSNCDADLIAAAPELLEALTTLQAYCIEHIHGSNLGNHIAAVVAKARGEHS